MLVGSISFQVSLVQCPPTLPLQTKLPQLQCCIFTDSHCRVPVEPSGNSPRGKKVLPCQAPHSSELCWRYLAPATLPRVRMGMERDSLLSRHCSRGARSTQPCVCLPCVRRTGNIGGSLQWLCVKSPVLEELSYQPEEQDFLHCAFLAVTAPPSPIQ